MKIRSGLICLFSFLVGVVDAKDNVNLSCYTYKDTKQLVLYVENAASLIEKKGEEAFEDFGKKGSKWFNDNRYLFVYDINGICVFHPVQPTLVGQNLLKLQDINRTQMGSMINDIGHKPQPDANGWIFYLWEESWKMHPQWKGSYVRKAVAPNGKIFLVGSGLYRMKLEKVFLEERVDAAAEIVRTKNKEVSFDELSERLGSLRIFDSYIIVLNENGDVLVDPSFPGLVEKRNMSSFQDSTGRNLFSQIKEKLKDGDRGWILYIWPKGDTHRLTRYLLYARKVENDGQVFYVFSDYAPEMPVWMK